MLAFLVTGGFAVLVVLTLLRDRDTVLILPDTRKSLVEQRASADNAYADLQAAIAALPEKPPPLIVDDPDDSDLRFPYDPRRGSLGELLSVQRPEDDGEFLSYLSACARAFEHVRSGLSKPFVLLGKPDLSYYYNDSYSFTRDAAKVGVHLIAAASAHWRVTGNKREALELLADAIRLSRMLASATNWIAVEERALREVRVLARTSAAGELERLQNTLVALGEPPVDVREILEVEWRRIDDALTIKPDDAELDGRTRGDIWTAKHAARFIHDERETIAMMADGSLPELEEWLDEAETSKLPLVQDDIRWTVRRQIGQIERAMILRAEYRATLLTLALSRYERTHGSFPDALDELAPAFIDSAPASPLGESGFEYKRDGDGFEISSKVTRLRKPSTLVHVQYQSED